ncbi:hypothetical protein Trydic_g16298 [Trypoxylus dichotomus]
MEKFLDNLNRAFFEKILASENSALKSGIAQNISKRRTCDEVQDEDLRHSTTNQKAPSKIQEDGVRWAELEPN